jgi:hypothetical protein
LAGDRIPPGHVLHREQFLYGHRDPAKRPCSFAGKNRVLRHARLLACAYEIDGAKGVKPGVERFDPAEEMIDHFDRRDFASRN